MSAEVRQLALFAAPDRYGTTDMFVTPGTDAPDAEAEGTADDGSS